MFFLFFLTVGAPLVLWYHSSTGIVMGALYLIYSQVMIKRGGDNINHDAHFTGAIFGFIFPLIINYRLFSVFIERLLSF